VGPGPARSARRPASPRRITVEALRAASPARHAALIHLVKQGQAFQLTIRVQSQGPR